MVGACTMVVGDRLQPSRASISANTHKGLQRRPAKLKEIVVDSDFRNLQNLLPNGKKLMLAVVGRRAECRQRVFPGKAAVTRCDQFFHCSRSETNLKQQCGKAPCKKVGAQLTPCAWRTAMHSEVQQRSPPNMALGQRYLHAATQPRP